MFSLYLFLSLSKAMGPWIAPLVVSVCGWARASGDPRGHNQPFGTHTVPHDVPTVSEFPTPWEFYEKYMLPGRPVVFKSILKRVNFPPYALWDDEYLREKYGNIKVEAEKGKKESRTGDMEVVSLREFLNIYKEDDIYMVQDLKTSMFGDMAIPRSIKCGGFQNFIETVIIWFSSGGTKSVIHFDSLENFNCLLDGTKKLVLVDRKYQKLMEADGFYNDGSYSSIDVDSVDMHKHPRIQEVPTFETTLEPGDCMYIPYKWYHQVNSFGNRNLAVNIWFDHIPWFNYTDCNHVDLQQQTVPFQDYGFIKEELHQLLFLFYELLDTSNMTTERFMDALVKPEADDRDDILKYADKDGDSTLTWEDLLQIKPKEFIQRFKDSLDISPTFFEDVEQIRFKHDDDDSDRKITDSNVHDEF